MQAILLWALPQASLLRRRARDWRYVFVLDCGSSGTRAAVFRIHNVPGSSLPRLTLLPPTAAPAVTHRRSEGMLVDRVETRPGIAEYFREDARLGVSRSLRPLLDWAAAAVPADVYAQTAVLLYGTAGLRSLGVQERAV